MAINKTGAIFKSLTFDGESSRDYGIYITGEAVFNAPEREVEMIAIPNRNGAFALDKGRFENIEVTYPAGVFAGSETDFAKAISDFRNMLCSRKGYCRLTDEYNPDEFRLAVYKSGLEVDPVALRAGEFDITFECKPQRYLMSGENKFIVGEWGDTDVETGDIIDIDNTSGAIEVKSAEVALEPKQGGTPWQDSTVYNTPFLFKRTPSVNHSINSKYTTLVGADVAVNQLVTDGNFETGTNWYYYNCTGVIANNTVTVTPSFSHSRIYKPNLNIVKGHKYLRTADYNGTGGSASITWYGALEKTVELTGSWQTVADIIDNTYDTQGGWQLHIGVTNNTGLAEYKIRNVMLIDLTQMLGTSIADTAYTKEQATAGSGIAWLKANGFDFSKYIAYNAGSLESVNPSAMKTVGFNQWDEEWEVGNINSSGVKYNDSTLIRSKNYIPVLPSTTYYDYVSQNVAIYLYFYDADKNYIGLYTSGNGTFTTPANGYYILFKVNTAYGTTYNHDICINLSKTTGTPKNGDYRQYNEHEYDLGNVPLHGKFDLVDGNIVAVGDTRDSGGNVTKYWGYHDIISSDIHAVPQNSDYTNIAYAYIANLPSMLKTNTKQAFHSKFGIGQVLWPFDDASNVGKLAVNAQTDRFWFGFPAGTTEEQMQTALNGTQMIYELATPTTDTVDPFTNPQVVEEYGTEEFVTSNDVPVGNNTVYGEFYEITGGADEVTLTVADDPENPTESQDYTTDLGQYVAGGSISMLDGVGTVTYGKIDYYNGESINEPWLSNLDEYTQGGTPTTGACVVYPLTNPTTLTLDPVDIELYDGIINYIWSEQGTVTIEYGNGPDFIVNPTLFGCGPLIETKGYGNISFNGHTISLANGAIGTVNLWNRTHGGSLNGSITKKFATGQFNPTDTFSFTVSHMFTLYEDSPSIVNTNGSATNGYSDNNDGSVTYWIDLPCTFTVGTTNQTTNKSTYTFGSKKVIANMSVSYDSSTGTVVYSVTTETVNNPTFASSTQFGFTISDCNATSTLDRLGNPTYIDCDLGEAYKINDGDIVSLNSFIDLGSNLPELASGPNKITCDNTFTEVAVTPRWWTV